MMEVLMAALAGHTILIVEDEPMIALHVADFFLDEGANTIVATSMRDAMLRAGEPGLTCALVDHRLGNETTEALCAKLRALALPFVLYTGYPQEPPEGGIMLAKPATRDMVIAAIIKALASS
jgi:DNA-binding NtrC family response regulator